MAKRQQLVGRLLLVAQGSAWDGAQWSHSKFLHSGRISSFADRYTLDGKPLSTRRARASKTVVMPQWLLGPSVFRLAAWITSSD